MRRRSALEALFWLRSIELQNVEGALSRTAREVEEFNGRLSALAQSYEPLAADGLGRLENLAAARQSNVLMLRRSSALETLASLRNRAAALRERQRVLSESIEEARRDRQTQVQKREQQLLEDLVPSRSLEKIKRRLT